VLTAARRIHFLLNRRRRLRFFKSILDFPSKIGALKEEKDTSFIKINQPLMHMKLKSNLMAVRIFI
jgi:hypothetical protein